jgi:hypothetical protein
LVDGGAVPTFVRRGLSSRRNDEASVAIDTPPILE